MKYHLMVLDSKLPVWSWKANLSPSLVACVLKCATPVIHAIIMHVVTEI